MKGAHVSKRAAGATRRAQKGIRHGSAGARNVRARRKQDGRAAFIAVAVLCVALIAVAFLLVPRFLASKGRDEQTGVEAGNKVNVVIPDGAGGQQIAQVLQDAGVISDPDDFLQEVSRQNADQKMKSGSYEFVTGADVANIVRQLVDGPNSRENRLTVAEGLTVKQTAQAVEKSLDISADDFAAQAKASNYQDDYAFLKGVSDDSLEGYLYGKTYDLGESGVTADSVIRAMLDQYQKEVASLDFAAGEAAIKKTYGVELSDYDILKLASMIEKEAVTDEDRPKVASVFLNRLSQDMALQSDATMAYVTGGDVTAEDLKTKSPYNTYLNKGLPPTPICSPSIASIKAALSPDKTDYYYFLIIEQNGYSNHTFSKTYEEHQQAIAKAQAEMNSSSSKD